ncbi:MAG: hypothetical protein ABMB14_37610, partial [Myxococcota bacterium]
MTFDQVRAAIGDQLVWAVIAAGFALIGTLLAAVSVVQQRDGSGPTVGLAAGPALGVAAVAGLGWAAVLGGPQSAAADPASTECSVTTYAIVYLVAPLLVGPSLLTAIAAGAFAGARTPPRRVGVGLAVAAAGLGAGIAVTVGGIAAHDPLYPVVRA